MAFNAMSDSAVIIGTTTWGTTLSVMLAHQCMSVTLLARTVAESNLLESEGRNSRFLPETPFPKNLKITADRQQAFSSATIVILAVPSDRLRENIQNVREFLPDGATVVSATKGLELPSASRMSQVLADELPLRFHSSICSLSGPNLAKEMIQGKPTSTVVAGKDLKTTARVQSLLMSDRFRVYTSADLLGVELAGTLKNIVALGAGIGDGLEVGDNAKAAFVTRGLAEITRLGVAAGADPLTFAGLAGLGDVIATCASQFSRNRFVGEQLAQGHSWNDIRESLDNVVEGVNATQAALKLAKTFDVEMPIAETTYRVLYEGLSPREAAAALMERPARSEW